MKEQIIKLVQGETDTVKEREFNIQNIIDQREPIDIIKRYEETIKQANKKTIRYETIQGQMLKKFKDKKEVTENVGPSKSTVYFKIGLYKCLKKFPTLKNSCLSHYF